MIPRLSRPEMAALWSDESRYGVWLEVEILACEAQEHYGLIPAGTTAAIRQKAKFDPVRIDEIEKEVRHDVIAFLTNVGENVGAESRFIHMGMTSSDMIDTALAVLLRRAADEIIADIDDLLTVLAKRAAEHRDTICIGRSHGIHAEPTSFGMKLAGHYAAFERARARMTAARDEISTGSLSGAVGTYATIDPRIGAYVAEKLGLRVEPVATQIIPRDRHAMYFATLGVIASSLENLAVEIRHLQRTEVREAEESFGAGQKGSSAMPHKRNPIMTENITGLARLIRSAVIPAMENVALWHERDISHSSVERVIAPDATILTDLALRRMTGVIENLKIYPDRMKQNVVLTGGLVFSQSVLLALANAGMTREDAYRIVQAAAMKVWDGAGDFRSHLESDTTVMQHLTTADLDNIFDYNRFIARTGAVVDHVLGKQARAA